MLEIKGFKTKPLALYPQLHEPHQPRKLVPLGRELGEHLQDDLAVDGEVLGVWLGALSRVGVWSV